MGENVALRERLSRLSEASLRITEDLDTVLREVVDGARSLTGARIGGMTILDDSGQLQDFITSGLTPQEHQLFLDLPGGLLRAHHVGGPYGDWLSAGAGEDLPGRSRPPRGRAPLYIHALDQRTLSCQRDRCSSFRQV